MNAEDSGTRCPWPVPECPDDMCRHSVERGLCGKYVPDPSEDDESWGEEYPEDKSYDGR